MAADEVLARARQLPSGAVFHRCALQVNPHHYGSTYRGKAASGDAGAHAAAIIQRASELGISVLAITDHNHVGGVAAFRAAAEGKEIHIFPGFELSSTEGIHVLCVYAPDTTDDLLSRYLGAFGITDTNPSAKLADKPFVEILAKVREQGGVAIAAHVTSDNGLLKAFSGQARVKAWRCEYLLAIQIPGPVDDLPPEMAESFNAGTAKGVLIAGVVRGGPADRAGVRPGDILAEVNGKSVPNPSAMLNVVAAAQPGSQATLKLLRNGSPVALKLTVGKRPKLQRARE